MHQRKNKPKRLPIVFQRYDPPLYFVTLTTRDRRAALANQQVHSAFTAYCDKAHRRGIAVGRYVIMPDHFLCGAPHK